MPARQRAGRPRHGQRCSVDLRSMPVRGRRPHPRRRSETAATISRAQNMDSSAGCGWTTCRFSSIRMRVFERERRNREEKPRTERAGPLHRYTASAWAVLGRHFGAEGPSVSNKKCGTCSAPMRTGRRPAVGGSGQKARKRFAHARRRGEFTSPSGRGPTPQYKNAFPSPQGRRWTATGARTSRRGPDEGSSRTLPADAPPQRLILSPRTVDRRSGVVWGAQRGGRRPVRYGT